MGADERELPQSRRISWWTPAEKRIRKLLAADVKSVNPRRKAGR